MERKSIDILNTKIRLIKNNSLPKIAKVDKSGNKISRQSTIIQNMKQNDSQYDSTTDFFQRNYDNYLHKINRRSKFYNSKLMTETELNSLLYKLKNYYSDVIAINHKKQESIILLKETLNFENIKLNQVIEFQDIELPDEKISVKNFNELKLTKNEVEKKLRNLLKEKQNLDELIKNAWEYFKTIEYMCEDEKNRFMEIKKETNVIEERIHNINQYQRIIDYNLGKDQIKNEEVKEINLKLKQDIDLVDKVNENQKRKNEKLDKIILNKEKNIEELKNKLLQLKRLNKNENNLYQSDIKQQIEKAMEIAEAQKNRERKCVEIIYCLFLIQNYFINQDNFDRQNLQSSNEYKLLFHNKFDISFKKKVKKELNQTKVLTSPSVIDKHENTKYNFDENNIDKIDKIEDKIDNIEKTKVENEKEEEKKNGGDDVKFNMNLRKKMSLAAPNMDLIKKEEEDKNEPKSKKVKKSISTDNIRRTDLIKYMNKIEEEKEKKEEEKEKKEEEKEKEKNGGYMINNDIISNHNNQIEDEDKKSKAKSKSKDNIKMSRTFNVPKMNKTKTGSDITTSTHSNNIYTSKKSFLDIPSLEELKEKFESLNINKEALFNYNSKLTSTLNFYKTQFNKFHNKEIKLEEEKSLFHKKATQVISEDYLTFTQLAKIKPKIKEFIMNNSELITEIKYKNKKNKLNKINQKIIESNPASNAENLDNVNHIYQIDDQLYNNANSLISSSERIIISNKNFLLKCNDHLKQIINAIDTINNIDKKENEKKKNNKNDDKKSELESKENKAENISDIKINRDFTKMFTDENEKLEKLLKEMEKNIPIDKKTLVNYIKDLIEFTENNEELNRMFDKEELNNDLLYHFYRDPEGKKIKTAFYNQFELKRFPKLKDTFNHFTIYIDQTIYHIKEIMRIINEANENNNLNILINIKNTKFPKKSKEFSKINVINLNNKNRMKDTSNCQDSTNEDYEKSNTRYISRISKSRIFQGFGTAMSQKDTSYSELEFMSGGRIDEDDILDNQVEKKQKKIVKKRANSIEENIVNKLYSPFLEKTHYLRKLNKNMKGIKSMTTYNCKANHNLKKRTGEVDIITHQMMIYNNPLINPNKLANPTYNSLVKLAMSTQNLHKKERRFRSVFTPKS